MQVRRLLGKTAALFAVASACTPALVAPEWPALSKKWFDRAAASYHQVDLDDAALAVDNALRVEPHREEIRLLAARVALADLEYDKAIRALEGLESSDARAIRGRALWYSGQVDRAADELDQLIADPEVRDRWAQDVAQLARRGSGRKPFTMSGGIIAACEMPQVAGSSFVVPLELDGEPVLGLVSTDNPEVYLDSGSGRQASWVSLRFHDSVEVKDVPALAKDLTGITHQLNVRISLLIGVNLLRHLRPTLDFEGSQFIVRTFNPPPPPRATTLRVSYVRGGGMVFRTNFGTDDRSVGSLLVDTALPYAVALDDGGWRKAGVAIGSLRADPNGGRLREGVLPRLLLGAFDVPRVPGVYGAAVDDFEKGLGVDLDGLAGAGLLAAFRVTLADGGRSLWLEDNALPEPAAGPPEGPPPAAPSEKPKAPSPSATPPS